MIEIGKEEQKLEISRSDIENRLIKHTCKTNLNPNLLFTTIYTDNTAKVFIGNWTKNGFWITRYRKQFINFRADIVAKGTFNKTNAGINLQFEYAIGFSSIVGGGLIIIILSLLLAMNGLNPYLAFSLPVLLYCVFSKIEVNKAKSAINKYLLNEYSEE